MFATFSGRRRRHDLHLVVHPDEPQLSEPQRLHAAVRRRLAPVRRLHRTGDGQAAPANPRYRARRPPPHLCMRRRRAPRPWLKCMLKEHVFTAMFGMISCLSWIHRCPVEVLEDSTQLGLPAAASGTERPPAERRRPGDETQPSDCTAGVHVR